MSPEPETKVTTSQESPWLPSEHPPALMPLATPHSVELVTIPGLSSVSSLTDVIMFHLTQSYPVILSGSSSVPSVTDLITSESAQSRVMVLQLPVFSTENVTT